ncbi:MAG: lysophospholipase [Candidatus Lokiarchaeota archaeon]|nr:lysophospholipase [Candidatus Lokiarchaeota archaeon]
MKFESFWYKDKDLVDIFVYKWLPEGEPKAIVQIAHGLAEHAKRYTHVAKALVNAGYAVYADDHRGHGKTGEKYGKLGELGPRGWDGTVEALTILTDIIKKEQPGIPIFLLGHSWGSFLSQDYIQQWGNKLQGVLLTGTTGVTRLKTDLGAEGLGLNYKVKNPKTPFDWLTRDEKEVEKYIEDPLSGFPLPPSILKVLGKSNNRLLTAKNDEKIPKRLKFYIFVGNDDPVGGKEGAKALVERYQSIGIKDITFKTYPEGRHELFNELNKDEVIRDVILWLNSHL